MEIDVEEVNVNFDWLETTLTQNGYYEIGEDEETGKFQPVLIPDWQEGDDYDIKVDIPQPTPTPPTFVSTEIIQNGKYEMVEGQNGWQPEVVQNPDPLENYDLEISVPQTITNPLETLTNKRIYSEGVVTISDLMANPSTNQGITKESTLNVNLYIPDVRFNPITNNNVDYTLGQLTQDPSEYFTRNSIIKAVIPKPRVYRIATLNSNYHVLTERLVSEMTKINRGNTITYYATDPTMYFRLDGSGIFYYIYSNTTTTETRNFDVLYWNFGNSIGDTYITFYDINENKLFEIYISQGSSKSISHLNNLFDLNSNYNNQWSGL